MAPSKRKRCGGQAEPESGQSELVSELDSAELTSLRAWLARRLAAACQDSRRLLQHATPERQGALCAGHLAG